MSKFSETLYERIVEKNLSDDNVKYRNLLNTAIETGIFTSNSTFTASHTDNDYYITYNKLEIHFIDKEDIFGVEIFLLDNENMKKFRVYTECRERMLTGIFHNDRLYVSGSWNKYVSDTFKELVKAINSCTEESKFDTLFKNAI